MKEIMTTGLICLCDDLDIEYKIARIDYTEREDESFTYVFRPYYNVIDLLSPHIFQGIPGLDLDLRKSEYVRENMIPVFISERTPGANREDLWSLLANVDMNYLNQLEWLIRTKTRYSGDRLYVRELSADDDKHCIELDGSIEHDRASIICRKILREICLGNDVNAYGFSINDNNRKEFYSLLILLYRNEIGFQKKKRLSGIRQSAANGRYRGRQRIPIDDTLMIEVINKFRHRKITEAQALKKLGISRSTFYRRLKEYEGNH